ncbi:competence type IV pilus assembly protein ComGB [Aerococcus sanguinicola]|uniref:competence type IV pilus assembly protein ComGB n=1 Tax=Aerococcus sanguinicola TaxID=119206 RepID=UPI0018A74F31|nr:competence type IV pilus assembly protein ComGB [Aerococcus sanguinicola]
MSSVKEPSKNITWKKIIHYEITSSWTSQLQASVLSYISEMLKEGFSLQDTLPFLSIVYPKQATTFQAMENDILLGKSFSEACQHLKLQGNQRFQIKIAEAHGAFADKLMEVANYLKLREANTKQIRQTLTYPFFLVFLILGMLFVMRSFLLPQIQEMGSGEESSLVIFLRYFLENLPLILVYSSLITGLVGLVTYYFLKKITALKRAQIYVALPFIGHYFRLYYTYFFAYEFSQLFALGFPIQEIIQSFQEQNESDFLNSFGYFMAKRLEEGRATDDILSQAGIFTQEFPAIVLQGEYLNQLAVKMRLYSQRCLKDFFTKSQQAIQIAKNALFIFVALLILLVYLSLMLPMLNLLGGLNA